jgi:hypothetical protein
MDEMTDKGGPADVGPLADKLAAAEARAVAAEAKVKALSVPRKPGRVVGAPCVQTPGVGRNGRAFARRVGGGLALLVALSLGGCAQMGAVWNGMTASPEVIPDPLAAWYHFGAVVVPFVGHFLRFVLGAMGV